MVKIVHTSDLHLGTPNEFYPEKNMINRKEDFMKSFKNILDFSSQKNVDLILIAGDFFHNENPESHIIHNSMKMIHDFLEKNSCKIFIVTGNHDEPKTLAPSDSPTKILDIFEDVEVTTGGEGIKKHVIDFEEISVGITMIGYDKSAPKRNPTKKLPKGDKDINIALLHGSIQESENIYINNKEYAPFNLKDCDCKNYDYYALGHIHKKQIIKSENSIFAYPGPPEKYSYIESMEKKGFFFIDAENSIRSENDIKFIELPARDFLVKKIKLNNEVDKLNRFVLDKLEDEVSRDKNKILTIILTGTLTNKSLEKINTSKIKKKFEDCFFGIKIKRNLKRVDDI